MKIVIFQQQKFNLWNPPPWAVENLRQQFPEHEFIHPPTAEAWAKEVQDAEVAIGSFLPPKVLVTLPKLKWVHSTAAAVHQYIVPDFVASPILLTNGRTTFASTVAEHVIAMMFALARQLPASIRFQERRTWGQQELFDAKPGVCQIQGATLGLVGVGSIGEEVARRAKALGMNVIAVRHNVQKSMPVGIDVVYGPTDLPKLLSQSDFVVLAAPVTASTHHLIGEKQLAQMPGAYLINVGRGALIDEVALHNALKTKQIAGAGLDVFEEEPLPAVSPLWALENLLITPHCGGFIANLWELHVDLIARNLRQYLAGEPLVGLVDKSLGY